MWGMQPGISKSHLSWRMVEVYDLECKLSMQYVLERHKTGSKTGLSTILMSGKKIIESGRKKHGNRRGTGMMLLPPIMLNTAKISPISISGITQSNV
jgi:hypothetical protein